MKRWHTLYSRAFTHDCSSFWDTDMGRCRITVMLRGFRGLNVKAQFVLEQQKPPGQVFVVRGTRGDIVLTLCFDGDRLCFIANRLECDRFVWPPATGENRISQPCLGIDAALGN